MQQYGQTNGLNTYPGQTAPTPPVPGMSNILADLKERSDRLDCIIGKLRDIGDKLHGAPPPVPASAQGNMKAVRCGLLGEFLDIGDTLDSMFVALDREVGRIASAV